MDWRDAADQIAEAYNEVFGGMSDGFTTELCHPMIILKEYGTSIQGFMWSKTTNRWDVYDNADTRQRPNVTMEVDLNTALQLGIMAEAQRRLNLHLKRVQPC